MLKKGSFSC